MTTQIGTLFLHRFLDMGLFIVVYDIGKRLGLRSIDTGDIRYITSSHLSTQYTPLHRRDNWLGLAHMRAYHATSTALTGNYCDHSIHTARHTSCHIRTCCTHSTIDAHTAIPHMTQTQQQSCSPMWAYLHKPTVWGYESLSWSIASTAIYLT